MEWCVFANTDAAAGQDIWEPGQEVNLDNQEEFLVGARSVIILMGRDKPKNEAKSKKKNAK